MRQLGDQGVLFDVPEGPEAAQGLARAILAPEVIPAADTVGVFGPYELLAEEPGPPPSRHHHLQVVLDGPDAADTGLSREELGRLLTSSRLRVDYLGFMPGFAYMSGLPSPLAELARRPTPRPRVEAGSLAVASGYAGIYPSRSPGGWNILGRTDSNLFDPTKAPYALLQPGDSVSFSLVDWLPHPEPPEREPIAGDALEVIDPGPLLLLEDLGRQSVGAYGVPQAGAFNTLWTRILNTAVGNGATAGVLESVGPSILRAHRPLLVALGGAELRLDGTSRPPGVVTSVAPGQEIALGPPARARSYLAVAGGIEGPRYFDSCSSDASSGLPPGPLRAADWLSVGTPTGRPRLRFELPLPRLPMVFRVIEGPDGPAGAILDKSFTLDSLGNRTGLRLSRGPTAGLPAITSHAVAVGSVQLPPDGQPIILGPDAGRVGGYPVIATVITADLWKLACGQPGDEVRFEAVSLEEARGARQKLDQAIETSVSGYFPTAFA